MSELSVAAIRTLKLMERLASESELGITELSSACGWSKASIYRILQSLLHLGYVRQNPVTEKYYLTTKLFRVGSSVIRRRGLTQTSLPVLEDLSHRTGETTNLAVLEGMEVVYLQKVESKALIGENIRPGSHFPAHCTALGKALLTELSRDALEAALGNGGLETCSPNSVTDLPALLEELEKTRQRGYAVDREELRPGLRCVAAAVRDGSGQAVAAISIAGPAERLTMGRLPELGQGVMEAAESISLRLGYIEPSLATVAAEMT